MCDGAKIVRARQHAIRREMDRRGMLLKVLALDSGVPESSIASYFPADAHKDPAVMPTSVLHDLLASNAELAELLSLLLPAGFAIMRLPEGVDHDAAAAAMHDYLAAKVDAHRPDSEAGRDIGPGEHADLTARLAAVPGVAAHG